MEKIFGTGAIKDKKDKRDYQFSDIASALEPFNWVDGYDVEKITPIKVKDQNGSSSCGGQAWGYYGQVLDPEHVEKSAKFIYAQTHVLGGGSAGRTNSDLVIKKGWGDETLTPSYSQNLPPSEAFMIKVDDITDEAYKTALKDKALSYANVNINIDDIALAIRENQGCIIGITGKNNGTWTGKFPKPPSNTSDNWRHWIFCGKALLINGKKYIGFINSWGDRIGEKGWQYISEDYVKTPYVWSAWTLVYDFPLFKFTKTLKFGMVDDDVKELQKRLGVIQTGFFGILTLNAVKKYQIAHNLKGDGIVGILTINSLNK